MLALTRQSPGKCLFILASLARSSIRASAAFVHSVGFMSKHALASSMMPTKAKQPKMSSTNTNTDTNKRYKIYCDLDGVLCDFVAGFRSLSGEDPDDMPLRRLWGIVARADSFYKRLPWTSDGPELWEAIRHLEPDILTGVPRHYSARREKAEWCRRELGVETNHVDMAGDGRTHKVMRGCRKEGVVNVITCWSRNKHRESDFRTVLIDDRENLAREWEIQGGIFIHHTSTERTLQQLKELGILQQNDACETRQNKDSEQQEDSNKNTTESKWGPYDTPPDTP